MSTREHGYIALISVIIISVLLMTIAMAVSLTGFFSRFNILSEEYKERSLALAEACADTALLSLSLDPGYNPSNQTINIGSDACVVVSKQINNPSSGQTTILTSGQFQQATTNLKVVVGSSDLSLISWQEIANF